MPIVIVNSSCSHRHAEMNVIEDCTQSSTKTFNHNRILVQSLQILNLQLGDLARMEFYLNSTYKQVRGGRDFLKCRVVVICNKQKKRTGHSMFSLYLQMKVLIVYEMNQAKKKTHQKYEIRHNLTNECKHHVLQIQTFFTKCTEKFFQFDFVLKSSKNTCFKRHVASSFIYNTKYSVDINI